MRQPKVEYPPEILDDPTLPLPERVERMMARDDLDWEARQAAYGNVVIAQFGHPDNVGQGTGLDDSPRRA